MDEVCEVSDALMERYLEGGEISHDEIVDALKEGTNHGKIFPVVCGVATRNLGTTRLLDAIVEDLPSPVKHGSLQVGEVELTASEEEPLFAYVFKTRADPFAGRINLMRVYQGVMSADSQVLNTRAHVEGAHRPAARVRGQGGRARGGVRPGRHRRRRQAQGDTRRRLAGRARRADRDAAPEAAGAGDGVRGRAARAAATRRRCSRRCAACRRRTRRSTCTATSRPASRSSPASRRCTSK